MLDPKPAGPMTGGSFWGSVHGAQALFDGTATQISGIKVVDPYTLEIDLDNPNQSFLNIIAMPFGFVIPKEAVGGGGGGFGAWGVGGGGVGVGGWGGGWVVGFGVV